MIEVTDEMADVFERAGGAAAFAGGDGIREGLAAVLALVQRDYAFTKRAPTRCGVAGFDGITCQRAPGHDKLHGWSLDGELVRW